MTEKEFMDIRNLLQVYPGCCRTEGEVKAWWSTFRNYDYKRVRDAVENYIRTETRTPVPAAIIGRMSRTAPKGNIAPRYEKINGKETRVYQCLRCRDEGIVQWEDEEQRVIGRPCLCEAGRTKYPWGFKTKEEKEEYIRVHGYHGEDMDYDVPALWAKDGVYE